jgi:hypothetical protein
LEATLEDLSPPPTAGLHGGPALRASPGAYGSLRTTRMPSHETPEAADSKVLFCNICTFQLFYNLSWIRIPKDTLPLFLLYHYMYSVLMPKVGNIDRFTEVKTVGFCHLVDLMSYFKEMLMIA